MIFVYKILLMPTYLSERFCTASNKDNMRCPQGVGMIGKLAVADVP